MSNWNENSFPYTNDDEIYRDFFNKTGASSVSHYAITPWGDPSSEQFFKKVQLYQHIYKTGDNLSKIAYKYYGSPKYWWVLAWFNTKPTDFHCRIGDTIVIPVPLGEAINQALNTVEI